MSVVTRSVLVFDICSSTTIVRALHEQSAVATYYQLLDRIGSFLQQEAPQLGYEIYKFIGDGFILLIDDSVGSDEVLFYSIRLVTRCQKILREFIKENIPSAEMARTGITCGLDKGWLVQDKVLGKLETIGRPMNVACRLQGELNRPEHANKLLMTGAIRAGIDNKDLKISCYKTMKQLRNLDDRPTQYFEFDPMAFDTQQWSRATIRRVFEDKSETDKDISRRLREIFLKASTTSVHDFIGWTKKE